MTKTLSVIKVNHHFWHTGNVGAFDVTASTWFGSNVEYVHGINM
jgi:hypothetical protein